MALSATEQGYYDHAKQALPRFLFQYGSAPQDILGAFATMFGAVHDQTDEYLLQAYIQTATGIWLDQHAKDYGTTRRVSETDATLRSRLGTIRNVVVPALLLAQIATMLEIDGVEGTAVMVETRRDKAFFSDATPGGTRAFMSRGYRMGGTRPYSFVVILPYPTTSATAAAVYEFLRLAKAGGFKHVVERRTSSAGVTLDRTLGSLTVTATATLV